MDLELPRWSSTELVARFGNDEAAVRRYRMLVALVREGRAPGEVARTFGVSRESLRRLRRAVALHGINALQHRKRGGGHVTQGTPLAMAVQQELRAAPNVPAAVLWRRVQSHLQAQGLHAPRSTVYRLLAQLRDAELPRAADDQLTTELLRDALGALAEDPPLALGKSNLALLLLPDVRDPLQRGRWMQRAIRAALKQLRPSEAGPVIDDPRWRHFLIIAGEYEVGEKRSALQSALALSPSTYSRAKREGFVRLLALLPDVLATLPAPEPPAAMIAAPNPVDTVDEAAIDHRATQLRRDGLVVLWGRPGGGKTDLAAALALQLRARGQKVVWHACRPVPTDTSVAMHLLTSLAAALALEGQYQLWNQLREPVPFVRRVETLAQSLAGRRWTVLVIHAEALVGDEAASIMRVLLAGRERRDLRLVVTSRVLPDWADPERWPTWPTPDDADSSPESFIPAQGQPHEQAAFQAAQVQQVLEHLAALAPMLSAEPLAHLSPAQLAEVRAAMQPIARFAVQLAAAPEE